MKLAETVIVKLAAWQLDSGGWAEKGEKSRHTLVWTHIILMAGDGSYVEWTLETHMRLDVLSVIFAGY